MSNHSNNPNEKPLRFNIGLRSDDPLSSHVPASFGPSAEREAKMAATLMANFKTNPDATLFYSRDRTYYSKRANRRYFPAYVTHRAITGAVHALVLCGLIEELRTPPSPRAKCRSTIRATELLKALLNEAQVFPVGYIATEPVVLRRSDKSKEQIDYVDTDDTRSIRADLQQHNAFLSSFTIGLEGEIGSIVEVEGKLYDLSSKLLYRVFNGNWDQGGRWYGSAWQTLPQEHRKRLTINGGPTCEEDFRNCHIQLLCAIADVHLPFDDPDFDFYQLHGFERQEVKYAVQILLNASSGKKARGALIEKLREIGVADAPLRAKRLCKAIPGAWPQLAAYWFTGIGLRLQRIDSDICARVQADMRAHDIPVLSVHDSFIVPVAARQLLLEVMHRAMTEACAQLRAHPLDVAAKCGAQRAASDPIDTEDG